MTPDGLGAGAQPKADCAALRIDAANAIAMCGEERLRVSPRAFAVLDYLVKRAGKLVEKGELHRTVWRGAIVSDGALVVCIRELREALGDDARHSRYIETVHRRGYRFIGRLAEDSLSRPLEPLATGTAASAIIGREFEMSALWRHFERAQQGEPQMVFIAGDPGIGKTTLVTSFLKSLPRSDSAPGAPLVTHGQCVDQYGATEPYLPLLEALDRLCRGPGGSHAIELLEREAPTWLAQLPSSVAPCRYETVLRRAHGVSQLRALRELAIALECLSAERLLVLVLEDLHWSDPSTVSALAILARRGERARLLTIGTFRPAEVSTGNHPLRTLLVELSVHSRCVKIEPRPWGAAEIATYLGSRTVDGGPALVVTDSAVVRLLAQRTGGNPLFVTSLVDSLRNSGALTVDRAGWDLAAGAAQIQHPVPAGIRSLLMRLAEHLECEERAVLEAASVAGLEFSSAAVAAALDLQIDVVERQLAALATQGQFVQLAGITHWPDDTLAARYAFLHAMHQQAWFEQVTPTTLQLYHRRIGLRKEAAWGARAADIAAELAVHFVDGRELPRAVSYLRLAGAAAARRAAHNEAVQLLTLGLDLIQAMPPNDARDQEELQLQTTLGPVLMALRGYAAPEVERTYAAARSLSRRVGTTPQMFAVLYGLWTFYVVRPRHRMALAIADRLSELAAREGDLGWKIEAHWAKGCSSFLLGDLDAGYDQYEQGAKEYRRSRFANLAFEYGQDPAVISLSFGAITAWYKGLVNQALAKVQEAAAIAQGLGHPFSVAYAMTFGAWINLLEVRYEETQELASAGLKQSATYEIPMMRTMCRIFHGIAAVYRDENAAQALANIASHIDDYRRFGGECIVPHFLALYAAACAKSGVRDLGLAAIDEALALVERNDERWCEAELHRVKATMLLLDEESATRELARTELATALSIAEQQNALLPALRAAIDIAMLPLDGGQGRRGLEVLGGILARFTEGFDYVDLVRARSLLAGEAPVLR